MKVPQFETKKEISAWLVANKARLISLKKAEIKHCDGVTIEAAAQKVTASKADLPQDTDDTIYRTIVGNTYNWMDSHTDVHIPGIFTKTIQETGDKVLHLHDHVYQLDAEVGDNLKVYEKEMSWRDLGVDKSGKTTALLMDTAIQRADNPSIFRKYANGRIQQHSVGMRYVKLFLAINDPEQKEEFATWQKYIDQVANKEVAEEIGYFWAVTEAKLIEISAVIRGSNEVTPTLDRKGLIEQIKEADENTIKEILQLCKDMEPGDHSETEPPDGTQEQKTNYFMLTLKNSENERV